MKKFWQRLLVILFPLGIIYSIGKALFSRGDFVIFLGCLSISLLSFIGGVLLMYNNPQWIEPILTFLSSVWTAVKVLFS
jgi:hypothetical protein